MTKKGEMFNKNSGSKRFLKNETRHIARDFVIRADQTIQYRKPDLAFVNN